MMLAWQNAPLDSAMFYDARLGPSIYGGLFNCLTNEPYPAYYAFVAFNRLYSLKNQVAVEYDEPGIYVIGAFDGTDGCLIMANTTEAEKTVDIELGAVITECRVLADGKDDALCEYTGKLPAYSVISIKFRVKG